VGGDKRTARYAQTASAVIPRHTAYAGRESNPHAFRHTDLNRAWLPLHHQRISPRLRTRVTDRIRTGPLTLAKLNASH
jgi:hypothetical protein